MKQVQIFFLLVPLVITLTALKKNYPGNQSPSAVTGISIGNTTVAEGNAGQRTIEVMVVISPTPTSPVSVAFHTKNKSAAAGSDYVSASGTISFAAGEMTKRVNVSITGDQVCESDEVFEIILDSPSGAALSDSIGTVTVANDDCRGPGTGGGLSSGRHLSTYEVRLTYTGYVSLYGIPTDCPIRHNGRVILTGLLTGAEDVDTDDDINYRGVLQLDIDIDVCSVMRLANGEDRFCGIRALGFGEVNTELEVQFDQRGGYIKIENKSNEFIRLAGGSCDEPQRMEEQDMIPNKSISSIFNGFELPMLTNRTLTVGRYVTTGDTAETVVEVLRKLN
jgi:hypothetical protein